MMRYAMMVAAFGMMLGAPVLAPTALMSAAQAQDVSLEAQLIAAVNDPVALQAIISAEVAVGNADGVALALSKAASSLAATDTGAAAALVAQAVTVAESASASTQATVGGVASAVATTAAESGDTAAVAAVDAAVASSGGAAAASYSDAGGSQGSNVQTSTAVVVAQATPTPSVAENQTPEGLPGPPPPPTSSGDTIGETPTDPIDLFVPTIPEPNPAQVIPPEIIVDVANDGVSGDGAPASP